MALEAANKASLENCVLSRNKARRANSSKNRQMIGGDGGGLWTDKHVRARIESCTMSHNEAEAQGGAALFVQEQVLNNCAIHGNTARQGGGIAQLSGNTALYNTLIQNNTAVHGGGIYSHGSAETKIRIKSSCIVWNEAEHGSAISSGSSLVIESSAVGFGMPPAVAWIDLSNGQLPLNATLLLSIDSPESSACQAVPTLVPIMPLTRPCLVGVGESCRNSTIVGLRLASSKAVAYGSDFGASTVQLEMLYLVHSETKFAAQQQPQPGVVRMRGECSDDPCGASDTRTLSYPPSLTASMRPLTQADATCQDEYTRVVSLSKSAFCIDHVCDSREPCRANVTAKQLDCPDGMRVWDRGLNRFCKPSSDNAEGNEQKIVIGPKNRIRFRVKLWYENHRIDLQNCIQEHWLA